MQKNIPPCIQFLALRLTVAILAGWTGLLSLPAQAQSQVWQVTAPAEIQTLREKYDSRPFYLELVASLEYQPAVAKEIIAKHLFSPLPSLQFFALVVIELTPTRIAIDWDTTWYPRVKSLLNTQVENFDRVVGSLVRLDPNRATQDFIQLLKSPDLDPRIREYVVGGLSLVPRTHELLLSLQPMLPRSTPKNENAEVNTDALRILTSNFQPWPDHLRPHLDSVLIQVLGEWNNKWWREEILRFVATSPSASYAPFFRQYVEEAMVDKSFIWPEILLAYTQLHPLEARPILKKLLLENDVDLADYIPLAWKTAKEEGYQLLLRSWEKGQPMVPENYVIASYQLGGEEMARRFIATIEKDLQDPIDDFEAPDWQARAKSYLEEYLLPIGPSHPLRKMADKLYAAQLISQPYTDEWLDTLRLNKDVVWDWAALLASEQPGVVPQKTFKTIMGMDYAHFEWKESLRPQLQALLGAPYEELCCHNCLFNRGIPHHIIFNGVAYGCKNSEGKPCESPQDISKMYNAMLADAGIVERVHFYEIGEYNVHFTFILPPQKADKLADVLGLR